VAARVEVEERVVAPRVAVDALVLAAPVRVDRPAEGHPLGHHPVEQRFALDFHHLPLALGHPRRTSRRPQQTHVRLLFLSVNKKSAGVNTRASSAMTDTLFPAPLLDDAAGRFL